MDTDRNLLFGVVALQTDLITQQQFIDACTLWTSRKHVALAEVLLERGWIDADDRERVEYLLTKKLKRHNGDPRAGLAAADENVKRSLAAVADDEIQQSLAGLPTPEILATLDHAPGFSHDRYTLARLHATGGIGRVWLARDGEIGRHVALKELRPERAHQAALGKRFLQEARITGQLEHPGIVPVYALGRRPDTQQPFYTMRFVKGRTLTEAAREFHRTRINGNVDALVLPILLNAFVTVANTIAYAHSRGVLHRDLKGQNVVLGDFGEVVVLDWGLAKLVDRPEDPSVASLVLESDATEPELTVQGQAVGTPAYMAPEQADGRLDQIDRRTDVYGLGAILYEILTGKPPFSGSDTLDILRKVREEPPPPPRTVWAEVPAGLEAVCLRAMAKDPNARYASAAEPAKEVQTWQEVERRKAEEALRDSEALYHSLVETLPLNVWRKDLDGHFTFANKGFCDSFGLTLAELVGKDDFDLFPRELAEKYRADDRTVRETGQRFDVAEDHATSSSGKRFFVQCVKMPIFDSHGKIVGTQGVFWDLTERKLAEEERDRYFNESRDLMSVSGLDGRFKRINPAFERTLGYTLDELLAAPYLDFIHPDDRAATQKELERLSSGLETVEFENRYRCKDGSYRWLSWSGSTSFDSQPPLVYANARDVTETREAQRALRLSEERYRSMIAAMQDGIILFDAEGNYCGSNAAAERILGLTLDQLAGRGAGDPRWRIVNRDGSPFRVDEYPSIVTLRTGKPCADVVVGCYKPDGNLTWISINSQPLHGDDGISLAGVVASFEDITERIRLEEELEVLRNRHKEDSAQDE